MMTQNAAHIEPSLPAQGPGDRLQAARISHGLTLQDVANQMHLSESILNSLEENNFDDITAPIFVKGYLRSYARIVRLDENEIIDQYNHFYTDGDPPISSTSNAIPEINADDARVKWATRLVVVGLIALLTLWWWNRYQQPAQPLSLDSSEQIKQVDGAEESDIRIARVPARVESPTQSALTQAAQQELAELSTGTSTSPSADGVVVEEIEPVIEAATVASAENTPALPTADEIAEMAASVTTPAPRADRASAEQAQPVRAAAMPSKPALSGNEDLVIVVNADTWADIRDANGEKLVRDLLRAGRTLELSGKAPLQLFLGNGYGVSLTYKGEAFDISGFIKPNNTARFKLGQ
jgi:cytoskeleton protein RodZ